MGAILGGFMKTRTIAEPYKIKMVEHLKTTTREERLAAIRDGRLQHLPAAGARMSISISSPTRVPLPCPICSGRP